MGCFGVKFDGSNMREGSIHTIMLQRSNHGITCQTYRYIVYIKSSSGESGVGLQKFYFQGV